MDMNTDPEWLKRMAEKEDGGIVSVGELVSRLKPEPSPGPWATMAGAPWNVLDATGRRIAWFHGNDYQGESGSEDEANAALAKAQDH